MHRLLVACLLCLAPTVARASAPELFGFGSEAAGVAGAMAARAQGWSAGYYDPAALAGLGGVELSVGLSGFRSALTIDGKPQPILDPVGIVLGAAAPVPLRGLLRDRLFVGIALYVVPDAVVRVIARAPDEPFFPYYDNRTQRLVVLPSLAARLGAGFSFGLALNFLAGLDGQVQASQSAVRAIEPRVDEQVISVARVNLGLRWRSPADRFAAALVYRQRFSVPFSTSTQSLIAGEPLDVAVAAEGLYTPDEIVLGGMARPLPWLQLSADLTLALWSAWHGPWVTVSSDLPIVGTLSAPPPVLSFRDTVSLRVGAEAQRRVDRLVSLRLRAGYAFESSPIPTDQSAATNLIDGPKHTLALGGGLRFSTRLVALRLDAHGQAQVVQSMTLARSGEPAISGGGVVWSAGLMLTVAR